VTTSFGDHPHTAILKIPTGEPNGSKHEIPCTFEGMDGKHLKLEAPERISIWQLNIKVDQILTGLQSLCLLRSQLLNEGLPLATRGLAPVSGSMLN
jgi:hypothetical protein